MKTVHIVLNAHLDPIWLWSWRDGIDEVLNTSHYICNLLDRHPDIIYTRGEAWLYEQIQRIDPALFARIQAHVLAGRWSIVGGWYIQPDCNLPSGFALERQISLGKDYFLREFNQFPEVGYNVDSFGHASTFPGYLRAAGQSYYVMMRPGQQEMTLPACLFRWRGYADGPEVITFRIVNGYNGPHGLYKEHILDTLKELPEGVSHSMCFVGIGDHGGGPTEEMIAWLREHRDAFPGVRIEFSSPARYFAAIQPELSRLPLVVGELQMHAVGCYSVARPVKTLLRKAEHRLVQAEKVLHRFPPKDSEAAHLETAWKKVCFHHFHDTLGGTCLPTAFEDVHAQLGQALTIADEISTYGLRQGLCQLKEDKAQRLVFFNASESAFDDYVEVEPFLEWSKWQSSWRLVDEHKQVLPCQLIAPETAAENQVRLLFPLTVAPEELKTLRIIAPPDAAEPASSSLSVTPTSLSASAGFSVDLEQRTLRFAGAPAFPLPDLALLADASDTWSHGVARYDRAHLETAKWETPEVIDRGPLMVSLIQQGMIGISPVQAEWRLYQGKPWVEFRLRVGWNEKLRLLKLDWKLPLPVTEREDGVLGGSLLRSPDGRELPWRDWSRLGLQGGSNPLSVAILSPDVFAVDGDAERISLTLLRSSAMACHEPNVGDHPRTVFSDRGEHFFRFRFMAGESFALADLDAIALGWHRPLLSMEITRGMETRGLSYAYCPVTA